MAVEAFSAKIFEGFVSLGFRDKEIIIPGGYRHLRSGGRIAWSLEIRTKKKSISIKNIKIYSSHTGILIETFWGLITVRATFLKKKGFVRGLI